MPLFSDRAAVGKLLKLFSFLRPQQQHQHAAGEALIRQARRHGYCAIRGQGIIITLVPPKRKNRMLFCVGSAEWLEEKQLYLCLRGLMARVAGLSSMLMIIISQENVDLRTKCRTLSMYTIRDVVHLELAGARRYTAGPLATLAAYLPEIVREENSRYGNYSITIEK